MLEVLKKRTGFTLIAVVMIVAIIGTITGAIVIMVLNQSDLSGFFDNYQDLEAIAKYGNQRAIKTLENDQNWTDNTATLYSNVSYDNATYSTVLTNGATHNITITTTATRGDISVPLSQVIERERNADGGIIDSYYVNVATENAVVTGGGQRWFRGILLENINPTRSITISAVLISWDPVGSELLEVIEFDNTQVFSDPGGVASGTYIDTTDYYLLPNATNIEMEARFSGDMLGKTISVIYYFADGTSTGIDFIPGQGNTEASFLGVDLSSAVVTTGQNVQLKDITLDNLHPTASISIVSLDVAWFYDSPSRNATDVKLGTQSKWNGTAVSSSNILFTTPFVLSAGQSRSFELIFDGDSSYRRFTIRYNMSDNSSKPVTKNFLVDEAEEIRFTNDFALDLGNTRINGLELSNNHAEANLWITAMNISLNPDAGQTINEILIGTSTVFSGTAPQNSDISFSPSVTINAAQTVNHEIGFGDSVEATTINITYKFIDNTSTPNTFFTGTVVQANLFSIATEDVKITPYQNPFDMEQLYMSNTFGNSYTIDQMRVTWSPDTGQTLTEISINDTAKMIPSSATSGTLVDLTDTVFSPGASNIPLKLEFNNNMVSTDFTLSFIFYDSSAITVNVPLNPASWVAGDNFESGDFAGGHGFSGDWSIVRNVSVAADSTVYSGSYALKFEGKNSNGGGTAERNLDLTGQTSLQIRFVIDSDDSEVEDTLVFRFYDNDGVPHQSFWTGSNFDSATIIKINLSSFPLGPNCKIYFDWNGDKAQDDAYVDEIKFFN